MIAYHTTWLANLKLQSAAEKELNKGNISADEFKAIAEKHLVGFYTPGIGARIGLFILTCVIVVFADALIALIAGTGSSSFIESPGFPFFLGGLTYLGLELMVNAQKHYRSGVDDALLFISALQFSGGFMMLFFWHNADSPAGMAIAVFVISLALTLRFADTLMAAVCCGALFATVFFGWTNAISAGLVTAPFLMIAVSALVYWLIYSNRNTFVNYKDCFLAGQVISLLALYASGNYYIVQSLGGQSGPLPLGFFFWAWTIVLPFVYLGFGIRRKDVVLLRAGLLLITAGVLTFRNYYHVMPLDSALTLAGIVILGAAYVAMRYLKTPKHGFTADETEDTHAADRIKVESLIIAQTFSGTATAVATKNPHEFGGGDFGGGGSSDSF